MQEVVAIHFLDVEENIPYQAVSYTHLRAQKQMSCLFLCLKNKN